jgi:hypothetical protein
MIHEKRRAASPLFFCSPDEAPRNPEMTMRECVMP